MTDDGTPENTASAPTGSDAAPSGDHDLTDEEIDFLGNGGPVFRDEAGEYWGFQSIALRGVKQGARIDETEDGFVVDGELFELVAEPITDGDENAPQCDGYPESAIPTNSAGDDGAIESEGANRE